MAKPKRQSLGKGLDALFVDNHVETGAVSQLRLTDIEPNKNQPREDFDEKALRELADSIAVHGVLQPLVVRPLSGGIYQIVAGERRWRASRMAGLSEIPVVIKELSDSETLEIAIIENLQREDLNPVELAQGYQSLAEDYGLTQEQIATKVGKSRSAVANTVRLLNLPKQIQKLVAEGKISNGHARALLGITHEELLLETADRIMRENLTVREVETIAKNQDKLAAGKELAAKEPQVSVSWGEDSYYKEIELALSTELSRKVSVTHDDNKGRLVLEFYNKEDLATIAKRLSEE